MLRTFLAGLVVIGLAERIEDLSRALEVGPGLLVLPQALAEQTVFQVHLRLRRRGMLDGRAQLDRLLEEDEAGFVVLGAAQLAHQRVDHGQPARDVASDRDLLAAPQLLVGLEKPVRSQVQLGEVQADGELETAVVRRPLGPGEGLPVGGRRPMPRRVAARARTRRAPRSTRPATARRCPGPHRRRSPPPGRTRLRRGPGRAGSGAPPPGTARGRGPARPARAATPLRDGDPAAPARRRARLRTMPGPAPAGPPPPRAVRPPATPRRRRRSRSAAGTRAPPGTPCTATGGAR